MREHPSSTKLFNYEQNQVRLCVPKLCQVLLSSRSHIIQQSRCFNCWYLCSHKDTKAQRHVPQLYWISNNFTAQRHINYIIKFTESLHSTNSVSKNQKVAASKNITTNSINNRTSITLQLHQTFIWVEHSRYSLDSE